MLEQGWSKVRRFLLVKFRGKYVKERLTLRAGECGRCTLCCKVFFRCPFLVDNKCRIYGVRFEQCKAFPIDREDLDLVTRMGGKCGFSFGGDDE